MRVAVIDSGVNPNHPHVGPIAGGIHVLTDGYDDDYCDEIGHGTAVAGAIREKAPEAEIYAVRIFERSLAAPGNHVLRALDWCLDRGVDFINLSLGTVNARYQEAFTQRVAAAQQCGTRIVAAWEMNGAPALPGSLPGVVGVIADVQCPREEVALSSRGECTIYAASPYPRPIPGVPPKRNLHGISFAVANVTGYLAAQQQSSDSQCS